MKLCTRAAISAGTINYTSRARRGPASWRRGRPADDVGDSHRGHGERRAPGIDVEQWQRMEVAIALAEPEAPVHGHQVEPMTCGARRQYPWEPRWCPARELAGNTRRARHGAAARTSRGRVRHRALRRGTLPQKVERLPHGNRPRGRRPVGRPTTARGLGPDGRRFLDPPGTVYAHRRRVQTIPIVQLMCSLAFALPMGKCSDQ